MNAFEEYLSEKGLKYTHERRIIYEALQTAQRHFDADTLYASIRKKHRIARATVFRNIPLLLESGVLQKSVGPEHKEYYEKREGKGHHDHMFCIQCHRIIEFCSEDIERLQEAVCKQHKFSMTFHDHRIYGLCEHCRK